MLRRTLAATVAALLALTVTACSTRGGEKAQAAPPELPPTATSAPTTTTKATPATKTNERGLIPKKLGQTAGITLTDGGIATFAIDKITVDPPCHEFGTPPESGRTLLLSVRVATSGDQGAADDLAFLLHGGNFSEIGKDGVTRPSTFGMCTDPTVGQLPSTFGVHQKYTGNIEMVVPEGSGVLVLQDPSWGGWEWTY